MTDLAELVVRIKADATQLQSELKNATQTTQQSATQMTASLQDVKSVLGELGIAFSIGALVDFGKSSLDAAFNMQNMADRIGFSASTLSALRPILAQTGSSVDEFAHSVYMMNNFIQQAIDGNPKAIETLDKLGLSATALKALKPEDAMNAMVDAIYRLGNITDQTEAGRAVFSRQWASLIPIMTESKGHLEDLITDIKASGSALTDAEIKTSHDFWASIEDGAIRAQNEVIKFISVMSQMPHAFVTGAQPPTGYTGPHHVAGFNDNLPEIYDQQFGPPAPPKPADDKSAKGTNDDIAGQQKEQTSKLEDYITALQGESEALNQSKLSLEVYKAEKQAATDALDDYNNKLRTSAELTEQERGEIADSVIAYQIQADASKEANKAQEEQIQMAARMKTEIADSLTSIIMNYRSFGAAITNILQQITKQIIEMEITQPFTNAVSGAADSVFSTAFSSLFPGAANEVISPELAAADPSLSNPISGGIMDLLPHFATGGYADGTSPIVVGDGGEPEIFNPGTPGTITPMSKLGGSTVNQTLVFQMQPGLPETVNAAIRNAAPQIVDAAHSAVMNALQKGGADSRIVNKRS